MLNERLHGTSSAMVIQQKDDPSQFTQTYPSQDSQQGSIQRTVPYATVTQANGMVQEVRATANPNEIHVSSNGRKEKTLAEIRPNAKKELEVKKPERVKADKQDKIVEKKDVEKKEAKNDTKKEVKKETKNDTKKEAKNDVKKEAKNDGKSDSKSDNKKDAKKQIIKQFVVFSRTTGATVRLVGNESIQYKTSQMHNPERILVELDGEWDVTPPKIPNNPLVKQVRVTKRNKKTRVVLDLKENPKKCRFVTKQDTNLDVRIDL